MGVGDSVKSVVVGAEEAVGVRRNVARLSEVFGAEAPTANPQALVTKTTSSVGDFLRKMGAATVRDVPDGIGTLGGAVVGGAVYYRKHPVLGVIGGASLGRNVPALFRPVDRGAAIRNLVATGGGITGSIMWKRHPVWGFLGGLLLGGTLGNWIK